MLAFVWITKRQRNELFMAVKAGDLNLEDCQLGSPPHQGHITEIHHRVSESQIRIVSSHRDRTFHGRKVIGGELAGDFQAEDWDDAVDEVSSWARDVKYHIENPDLWDELTREREFLSNTGYESSSNSLFTEPERAEITAQIREIKEYIKDSLSLSAEQMSQVEARLNEAEAAASHIGRKDWLLLFMGVLFTLIVSGLVTPEIVQHIFAMTLHGLSHLFGGGDRPLKPPSIT